MYLERIDGPQDVKALDRAQRVELAREMRAALIEKLSAHGGHFGPNLGMVEATIALHVVFDSPRDKMVFDVSHQTYAHKMLTGRKQAFLSSDAYDDVTGYSAPQESAHDFFTIGHTSTSISLACGMAKARDLVGGKENIIAIIGDGSLSGGEAIEGLDYAAELRGNLIVVVNDNDMSIAENHGGLYENLRALRKSGGKCENNLFRAFGLDYVFVADGNDIDALIQAFERVKDTDHPTVVHICTQKGKGYAPAERDKERWHYCAPFDRETGKPRFAQSGEDYGELTAQWLLDKMQTDPRVVAITSGTPGVFGFDKDKRDRAGAQFVDVGIAEEHAVAMASGIATNGGKPVYGVYSTFLQRAYDQLAQDVCINGSPVTILVYAASVYGMNDVTHLGIFDIPMISNIPGLVYLAPTCKEQYLSMLHWAIDQNEHPVAIRVPADGVVASGQSESTDWGQLNRYRVVRRGGKVAILALGSFFGLGMRVAQALERQTGVAPTLIDPIYITGTDTKLLDALTSDHDIVVTLEDGVIDGGFGEKIARYYGAHPTMRVLNYGLRKQFLDRYDVEQVLRDNRLTPRQIVQDVLALN